MDLIHYMKKLELTNPEKVIHLKSSFQSAMQADTETKEEPSLASDGFGSAMLQVLARNVQSFTNDNNQSKNENYSR